MSGRPEIGEAVVESVGSSLPQGSSITWGSMIAAARPLAVSLQLALMTIIAWGFKMDPGRLDVILALSTVGFLIHHTLPETGRLPFFVALSIVAILLVFGLTAGGVLLGIGLLFIGLCHIPIDFGLRVTLIVGLAVILATLRAGLLDVGVFNAIFPILGAIFMFRMIVYLYDLRTKAAPFSLWNSLAYFFLMPNVVFPLFPVVDYKTFCRTRYNDPDAYRIYQTGLRWMARGLLQIIAYRVVYQYGLQDPAEVTSAGQTVRQMVCTFLLYLHVSGQFHLAVGMLHLFGFNLPETNHRYLVSCGFTDFWRRINIYWKDFMQKVFFFPAFFRLKNRMSELSAMAIATLFTFVATWALHSYQWFWLRGDFPVTWQDVTFWTALGFLVLIGALRQARKSKKSRLAPRAGLSRADLLRALGTTGTFVSIVFLWSIWTADSFGQWTLYLRQLTTMTMGEAGVLLLFLAGLAGAAILWGRSAQERFDGIAARKFAKETFPFWRSAGNVAGVCALTLAVGALPPILSAQSPAGRFIRNIRENRLNERDAALLERSYYEDLMSSMARTSGLWGRETRPENWMQLHNSIIAEPVNDIRLFIPRASMSIVFKDGRFTTNQWNMRDREYTKTKPPGVHRLVLVGESHGMGSGVHDEETFENVVEDRLNREFDAAGGTTYEILNFSIAGYGVFTRLYMLDNHALEFQPDTALYLLQTSDYTTRAFRHFKNVLKQGVPLPDDFPHDVLRAAGVGPETPAFLLERRMRSCKEELMRWAIARFKTLCDGHGVSPIILCIPGLDDSPETSQEVAGQLKALAESTGVPFLDMSGTFSNVPDRVALQIREFDIHPNAEAHRMLADQLYNKLLPHLGQSPHEVE